ncbi:hypothetical protein DCO49_03945 [Stenotrophomonas sp. SPM]|nr:hypothetical protein DCO49_03945 [Stenotrophomonas sp. SPM]
MADGAAQRLVAQIGEALFGQPGLNLMELAERVQGMRSGEGESNNGTIQLIDRAVDADIQKAAARWRVIAPHLQVAWDEDEFLKCWTWIDLKDVTLIVPTRAREPYANVNEAIDALIDIQRARDV